MRFGSVSPFRVKSQNEQNRVQIGFRLLLLEDIVGPVATPTSPPPHYTIMIVRGAGGFTPAGRPLQFPGNFSFSSSDFGSNFYGRALTGRG